MESHFQRPDHVQEMSTLWPGGGHETTGKIIPKPLQVRSAVGEPGCEQQAKATVKKIRKSERRRLSERSYRGRSDVYRYIRKNLPTLQADGFGTSNGPSWDELAETVNREGYRNQRGDRVSGDAIRKIFARALRDAGLEPQHAPPPNRSRQRSDWQPPMSVPASARPEPAREVLPPQAAPPAQPAPGATGSSPLDDLPPEAKAMIDRVRQAFAETDRKRFGRF